MREGLLASTSNTAALNQTLDDSRTSIEPFDNPTEARRRQSCAELLLTLLEAESGSTLIVGGSSLTEKSAQRSLIEDLSSNDSSTLVNGTAYDPQSVIQAVDSRDTNEADQRPALGDIPPPIPTSDAMCIPPLSPLTELSSFSDEDGDELKKDTSGLLTRRESSQHGSDASESSATASSSDYSLPLPPQLIFDCVSIPPFPTRKPKEFFRPMKILHSDNAHSANDSALRLDGFSTILAGSRIDSYEHGIIINSSQMAASSVTSSQSNLHSNQHNTSQGNKPSMASPSWVHKRNENHTRYRYRSPSPPYGMEKAQSLFGSNLTMYSLGGCIGGFLLGTGTLQCDSADDGRASFRIYMDEEMQRALAESNEKAIKENIPETSGPGGTRQKGHFSKPQTSKRRNVRKKVEMVRDEMVHTQEADERTTCHSCANKTNLPKMKCAAARPNGRHCVFRFCDRCIEKKFPHIQFDESRSPWTCPRCDDTCVCASCRALGKRKEIPIADAVEDTSPEISAVENSFDSAKLTHTAANSTPAAGPPALTRQSSLWEGAPAVARARSAALKRKAVQEESEEEASASPAEAEPVPFSNLVDNASYSIPMKRMVKRGRGPGLALLDLPRDDTPKGLRKRCHQCRNRNGWAKVVCTCIKQNQTVCGLAYCRRCIQIRYPKYLVTDARTFICFKCSNGCNCDMCCQARGESYVPSTAFTTLIKEALVSNNAPGRNVKRKVGPLKITPGKRLCKSSANQIDEEAEAWIRLRKLERHDSNGHRRNHKERSRAFVGEWPHFWGSMRSCVEMDSAILPIATVCEEDPVRHKPYMYTGRRNDFKSLTAPLGSALNIPTPLSVLARSRSLQSDALPPVQSRSGRTIKPSEKVRKCSEGIEDEPLYLHPQKKRRTRSPGHSPSTNPPR